VVVCTIFLKTKTKSEKEQKGLIFISKRSCTEQSHIIENDNINMHNHDTLTTNGHYTFELA